MDTDNTIKPKRNYLGVPRALIAALTIYFVPQFIAGFVIATWAQLSGNTFDQLYEANKIAINFIFSLSGAALGLLLVYLLTKGYGGLKGIGYKPVAFKKLLLFIPAYIVYFSVLIVVFYIISSLNVGIDLDQDQVVGFESATQNIQVIFAFITLVIIAPIIEETLFRGVLFTNLARKMGFLPAAILISGLFGLAHMQLNVGIDTFLLGMAASWLVWKTHSLYPAILLHMLKNSVAFVILFIVN